SARQSGQAPAAGAQRPDDAVAELEPSVEHREVRSFGRLDPPVDPDMPRAAAGGAHASPSSRAPIAPSGPAALARVSAHSSAGSLRQVIPPPTCRASVSPSATNVRMRMLLAIDPSGPIQPSVPVYGPRRTGSQPASSSVARRFAAPLMLPPGKGAPRTRRGRQ